MSFHKHNFQSERRGEKKKTLETKLQQEIALRIATSVITYTRIQLMERAAFEEVCNKCYSFHQIHNMKNIKWDNMKNIKWDKMWRNVHGKP